jgi:cellulose synthase/poly-beta-1,6-N-acetylglucosamine synthase-like glycosyltransferase
MIHTYIPYAPKELGNNLGWAYNKFMELVPEEDWVCFLDHDAVFTTRYWYYQLGDIIKKHQDVGLYTCVTNRIGQSYQIVDGINKDNHDIKYHRLIGNQLQNEHYDTILDLNNKHHLLSGVVILISKKTWMNVGGFSDGFLGVDNNIHRKCIDNNIKVGLMRGVYVYHWYRGDGDISHLK